MLPSGLHLSGLRPVLVILEELIAEIPLVHLFLLRPVFEVLKTLIFRAAELNLLQVSPVLLMLKELIAQLQHLWRLYFLEVGYSGGYRQNPIERLWNK